MDLICNGPITVTIHLADSANLNAGVAELKEAILMTIKQDFDALVGKIDEGTNKVSARIDALAASVKSNMTEAEVSDLKTKLGAEADKLEAMGKDPADPVPVDNAPV